MLSVAAGDGFSSWFDLIPGFKDLSQSISETLGPSIGFLNEPENYPVTHVFLSVIAIAVAGILVLKATNYFKAKADDKLTARTFFELILDGLMNLMTEMMGRKNAERYLPLIGTIAIFVFFSNAMALIPGFLPPTDNLNVTAAPAIIVFVVTHVEGVRAQGFGHYFAHFFGPVIKWYALPLMLLIFAIEIIGHLARPLSLSLRLLGNMFGDHAVLAIFMGIFPFILPVPNLILGSVVVIVQTLVFCILSIIYISMAVAHTEEAH